MHTRTPSLLLCLPLSEPITCGLSAPSTSDVSLGTEPVTVLLVDLTQPRTRPGAEHGLVCLLRDSVDSGIATLPALFNVILKVSSDPEAAHRLCYVSNVKRRTHGQKKS